MKEKVRVIYLVNQSGDGEVVDGLQGPIDPKSTLIEMRKEKEEKEEEKQEEEKNKFFIVVRVWWWWRAFIKESKGQTSVWPY